MVIPNTNKLRKREHDFLKRYKNIYSDSSFTPLKKTSELSFFVHGTKPRNLRENNLRKFKS